MNTRNWLCVLTKAIINANKRRKENKDNYTILSVQYTIKDLAKKNKRDYHKIK